MGELPQQTRICLGSDHAGLELKQYLEGWLQQQGHAVHDLGTHSSDSCDYPDYAEAVAKQVAAGQADCGILVCGTGVGMSITANKVPGVRAAHCEDTYTARMSREHNHANVLCLGGRVLGPELAKDIVQVWLETPWSGDPRHQYRVEKIHQVEARNCVEIQSARS